MLISILENINLLTFQNVNSGAETSVAGSVWIAAPSGRRVVLQGQISRVPFLALVVKPNLIKSRS